MSGVLHGVLASLAGVVKDAFFKYVTLLLPGNGTNGAQNNTFIDGSTNNFTITRNGNTTQGTFTPFGPNWSNYFDGTGDRLSLATATAFGNSSNTVEFWFYPTDSAVTYRAIYDSRSTAGTDTGYGIFQYGLTIEVYGNGLKVATAAAAFSANTWTHVALVRNSGTCQLYINGVASGASATYSSNLTSTVRVIGDSVNTLFPFVGYVSNLREVTSAVYTANFTPSTTPLTAITNTQLLTCQSNRFVDNSTNAFTITPNGDVSVQRFSPFSPTAAYSTSVIGGSGYFDGTGDYLSVANAATLTPSGNFTIEFWAYPITGGVREYYSKGYGIQIYTSGGFWGAAFSANNTSGYYVVANFGACVTNAWQHIAVYRSGNNYYGALNGGVTLLGTSSNSPDTGTDPVWIGDFSVFGGYPVTGYLSNVRYVNGTAVYGASNFTPSTSPLTAITNTSLLLNFTNAGIIDNAMMNDLETVGNAQISTAQSKFGGSSILINGTGNWLTVPSTENYKFGTGDFTIEAWIYSTSFGAYQTILDSRAANSTSPYGWFIEVSTGKPYWYDGSGFQLSSTGMTLNTWQHLAISRSGSTIKMFLNGTEVFSGTNTNSQNPTGVFRIGRNFDNDAPFVGYIDDFRITKGVARYTANFTPPAAAFPTS